MRWSKWAVKRSLSDGFLKKEPVVDAMLLPGKPKDAVKQIVDEEHLLT